MHHADNAAMNAEAQEGQLEPEDPMELVGAVGDNAPADQGVAVEPRRRRPEETKREGEQTPRERETGVLNPAQAKGGNGLARSASGA